jgi:hypothetical protein
MSGFLTIQLEMQNFLSSQGLGGPVIHTQIFRDQDQDQDQDKDQGQNQNQDHVSPSSNQDRDGVDSNGEIGPVEEIGEKGGERGLSQTQSRKDFNRGGIEYPKSISTAIADSVISARSPEELYEGMLNLTRGYSLKPPLLNAPLYSRAFPTHRYEQALFWHGFGAMISIALILYVTLPPAVTAGFFRREAAGGQLDVLSTLPGVRQYYSAAAWALSSAIWSLLSFCAVYLFFFLTLKHTDPLLPSLGLLLAAVALAPLSLALGALVKNADALVVAVPTAVFVLSLPGLLYVDGNCMHQMKAKFPRGGIFLLASYFIVVCQKSH